MEKTRHGTPEPGIDIVIPNWNGKNFLAACLDSLSRQTYRLFDVIMVDNGSTDGSVELVRQNYGFVRLITFPENRGFSAAANEGIGAGVRELVFLLNNDTELASDCLEKLVAASIIYDDAFFSPKMLNFRDRQLLDGAGDGFLRGGVGYRFGSMEPDGEQYGHSRQVFGACGGAALYRRSMLDSVGLFDEDFFAYIEDVDLNFRANRAGFTCRYIPDASVYHVGSATTGSRVNAFTIRCSTRNNLFFLVKNYPLSLAVRFFPALCVFQIVWFIYALKNKQVSAYFSGIFDFFSRFPVMRRKRKLISQRPGISNRRLVERIVQSEKEVVQSIMRKRSLQGRSNIPYKFYFRLFL